MARTEKLSFLGISAFTESMASMLEAGIENSEAISLLRQKEKSGGALDQGLQVMEGKLSEGASLSEAMIERRSDRQERRCPEASFLLLCLPAFLKGKDPFDDRLSAGNDRIDHHCAFPDAEDGFAGILQCL